MKAKVLFYSLLVAAGLSSCSPAIRTTRIILVPDTQTYAEKYPEILNAQLDWIAKEKKNIDFVIQQGDLTQNNNELEWELLKNSFHKIDGKVPYILGVGNHDMGSGAGKFADVRNTDLFNRFFPINHFSGRKEFGGAFEADKAENVYFLLENNKVKWLVLSLEFGPRNSVLDWANTVVNTHPNHVVILNTHCYMYSDNTRQGKGDWWRPQDYGIGKDTGTNAVNDGEQIWEKLVKINPNVRFVFSGHVLNTGVGTLISTNDKGKSVYQMLANYQEGVKGSEKGGNGYLRILDIDHRRKKASIKTYSPYTKTFMTDASHQFEFNNVEL